MRVPSRAAGTDGSELSAITAIAEADFSPVQWAEMPSTGRSSRLTYAAGAGAVSATGARVSTPSRSTPAAVTTPVLPRALDSQVQYRVLVQRLKKLRIVS